MAQRRPDRRSRMLLAGIQKNQPGFRRQPRISNRGSPVSLRVVNGIAQFRKKTNRKSSASPTDRHKPTYCTLDRVVWITEEFDQTGHKAPPIALNPELEKALALRLNILYYFHILLVLMPILVSCCADRILWFCFVNGVNFLLLNSQTSFQDLITRGQAAEYSDIL